VVWAVVWAVAVVVWAVVVVVWWCGGVGGVCAAGDSRWQQPQLHLCTSIVQDSRSHNMRVGPVHTAVFINFERASIAL